MTTTAMPASGLSGAPAGLNSPPESNSAMKDGGSDSELSDLEPEHEATNIPNAEPAYVSGGGVPVFKPTMEQFKDFQRYIESGVNAWGMKTGIVKVIPPPEWLAAQPRLDEAVKTIKVKEPIKQDIMGTSGTYRQANIVHQRSYNLPQWRQLCEQSEHQPPAKRGERRTNQDRPTKSTPKSKAANTGAKKKGAGRTGKNKTRASTLEKDAGDSTPDRLPTPVSPIMKPEDDVEPIKPEADDEEDTPVKPKGGRQPKAVSVSSRRKNNRREVAAQVDEAAFKDFKYELEGHDYSPERCEELERIYWKTLTYASPLYGADMPGTLFDERTTAWNLGKLENLLDVLGSKIPGVNTAYLYLGMWKATFAWHLEDVDLYSINYLHFGAPKQWYSISQGDARRFEAAMKSIWPTDAKACDQFLRHKTFLISPSSLLQNFNIKVNKIVHYPGEFVITFPYGYHSGYNLGYNCAEAVNFALDSWLEYGRVAKRCDCSDAQDSVWIDVREIERKLRGEETDYEETDEEDEDDEEEEEEENETNPTDLPTPPQSSGDTKTKTKTPLKKRKRPANTKEDNKNVKRIRIRIKAPAKEPCILCPNDIPSEPLLFTEEGEQAHRICALYIPETSIEQGEKETITDVKYIDKARLELKCNYCRSKKGACFQCSQKKCTRAYHATCAAAAGVLVEQGEIPVFGEDGTEYKDWGIEFSCRFHRTKRDKKLDADALDNDKRITKAAAELKVGEVCQMQYYRADIFAGVIVENHRSEEMVLVDILPRGERVEVEYKWLLIPDPADYRLPKPSANAKPMPKSYKDKESLNTSKRQADDLPRADDPFVQGTKWAEFNTLTLTRNPYQVKIDLTKENQVWYYLGRTSTEAKAQFTEDPSKPRNNIKGYFLDTIPKPSPAPPRRSYAASYPSNFTLNAETTLFKPLPPSRPFQSAATSSRPEKPYVYKPRDNSDLYSVDPQALRSQQNFLQRSAAVAPQTSVTAPAPALQRPSPVPYAFGTDPRFLPQKTQAPTLYHSHSVPVTTVPPPAIKTPLAPPPIHHRPMPTPAVQPKLSNPFSGRSVSSKPSVFAKYPYLQKEHNRSPLEYKSPYRPGGGFMNGYQGNLQKYLQHTLFQNRSGPGNSLNPILSYPGLSGLRPISQSQSPPSTSSYSGTPTSYRSYLNTPSKEQVQPVSSQTVSTSPPAPNAWQNKETSQLHPAIRQEYSTMYHNQYQSQTRPLMQPPAMYDRQATPSAPGYQFNPSTSYPQSPSVSYSRPSQNNSSPIVSSATASQAQYQGPTSSLASPTLSRPVVSGSQYQSPRPQTSTSQTSVPPPQHPAIATSSSAQLSVSPPQSQGSIHPSSAGNRSISPPQSRTSTHPSSAGEASVSSPQSQVPISTASAGQVTSSSQQFQTSLPPSSKGQASRYPSQYQTPISPASTSQLPIYRPQYQASAAPSTSTTYPVPETQPYGLAISSAQPETPLPVSQPQYQPCQVPYAETNPLYAHQEYFERQYQSSQISPSPAQSQASQPRDFPDVPADSTSIVEKMMFNLKKAAQSRSHAV